MNIPHDLGREEAHKRLQEGFIRAREQLSGKGFTIEEHWEGERLNFHASALGQKVTGRVDVFADNVRVEVDLPWLLAAIAGQLQGRLQKEGQLLLGNSK